MRATGRHIASYGLLAVFGLLIVIGCGSPLHVITADGDAYLRCANLEEKENTCSRCASMVGCGWCDKPTHERHDGKVFAQCQPNIGPEQGRFCEQGSFKPNTEACEGPPPPPPAASASARP